MRVTNKTSDAISIGGVSIPGYQSRNVKAWDELLGPNVQRMLADGLIAVPEREEGPLAAESEPESSEGPININTATIEELETLNGVGHQGALRIITHRPFFEVDDLTRVGGISEKIFERNRDRLEV